MTHDTRQLDRSAARMATQEFKERFNWTGVTEEIGVQSCGGGFFHGN